jgi:hypothetical protein
MLTKTKFVLISAGFFVLGCASTLAVVRMANHYGPYRYVECRVADITGASSPGDARFLNKVGLGWLTHARVCVMGGFTVAVPENQTDAHLINVYRGLKPVFQRTSDGTLVYSPTVPNNAIDQDIVNIWHPCEGDVSKLIYSTRGREPHVMVEDRTFSGRPDSRIVWLGHEIQQSFGMYQDAWHQMQKGKMLIDGQWQPMQFAESGWQVKDPQDSEPPSKSSGAGCQANE